MDISFHRAEEIRHAVIVCSPSLDESFRHALRIAQAAVCRGHAPLPCGSCPSCRKALAGTHPDISVLECPLDEKGKKKREIPVATVREVSADAVVLPNEAARKVYIFRDGEKMNPEAQNAALKLLEEPPNGAVFLLCVTNPARLLPTVRSRCTVMNFMQENTEENAELARLAEEYLRAVAQGNALALWKFCEENIELSVLEMTDFCLLAIRRIADMLALRRDRMKLSEEHLLALEKLLEECVRMLNVNVSAKQIFGLLETCSLPKGKGRKK